MQPQARPRTAIPAVSKSAAKDPSTQELKRRNDALRAAADAGNPEAVIAASKSLTALALRQVANLRMLVGAYAQAAELYRRSIELEDIPETRLNLAIASLRLSQPDEALEQTGKVLAVNANNARAWHLNGKAWVAKDDYRSAVQSLSRSLELADDVNAAYALGFCHLKLGEKPKAEAIFRQMLQAYGDRAIWHLVFAGAYREAGLADDAIREFRRALAMEPGIDQAHFYLGVTLLEQNHWAQTDESMAEFRAAVQQHPNDYWANFYLGVGESQLKLFESSNRHLKIAAELQPDTPEIWLYLGLNAFQQNNYETAKPYLLKAVALTGSNEAQNNYQIRRAHIALGRIYFVQGDKPEAEKHIERAKAMQAKSLANSAQSIADTMAEGGMGQAAAVLPHVKMPEHDVAANQAAVDPTAPMDPSVLARKLSPADQEQARRAEEQLREILSSAFNDWGTADARQGLYRLALEQFHEAERWSNTTPGLMRNIGLAAQKTGDMPEAIRALRVAVAIDPKDQLARSRLAMILFTADEYAEAAKVFESLGPVVFNDPAMTYAWAYSLVRLNQERKATETLNRLTSLVVPAELLMSAGDLYAALQDYEHAVATYRRALAGNPATTRAHYKTGAALLRLSRPDEAVPELDAELKISPNDPDVQYNLAYALLQTSQKERALSLLRSLIAEHPEHPQAQYELGKTLFDEGQLEEAVQHLEAAAKLDPARDYIHYQLQTAYRRVGRTADADRELKIYRGMKTLKREQVTIPQPEPPNK